MEGARSTRLAPGSWLGPGIPRANRRLTWGRRIGPYPSSSAVTLPLAKGVSGDGDRLLGGDAFLGTRSASPEKGPRGERARELRLGENG
eukprot:4976517-Heterocapsa_arctica.AAC.1